MNYFWWSLTLLVMLLGLAGTVLPLLPGTTIILAAAVGHHYLVSGEHNVGWGVIAGLAGLTVLSYLVDFTSSTVGAKWAGATKWGAIGGILGTIIGLFYGLVGVFIFPLLGVLAGELLAGKQFLPAWKSTVGTLLGTGAGLVVRFTIAVGMIAWFLLAAR